MSLYNLGQKQKQQSNILGKNTLAQAGAKVQQGPANYSGTGSPPPAPGGAGQGGATTVNPSAGPAPLLNSGSIKPMPAPAPVPRFGQPPPKQPGLMPMQANNRAFRAWQPGQGNYERQLQAQPPMPSLQGAIAQPANPLPLTGGPAWNPAPSFTQDTQFGGLGKPQNFGTSINSNLLGTTSPQGNLAGGLQRQMWHPHYDPHDPNHDLNPFTTGPSPSGHGQDPNYNTDTGGTPSGGGNTGGPVAGNPLGLGLIGGGINGGNGSPSGNSIMDMINQLMGGAGGALGGAASSFADAFNNKSKDGFNQWYNNFNDLNQNQQTANSLMDPNAQAASEQAQRDQLHSDVNMNEDKQLRMMGARAAGGGRMGGGGVQGVYDSGNQAMQAGDRGIAQDAFGRKLAADQAGAGIASDRAKEIYGLLNDERVKPAEIAAIMGQLFGDLGGAALQAPGQLIPKP